MRKGLGLPFEGETMNELRALLADVEIENLSTEVKHRIWLREDIKLIFVAVLARVGRYGDFGVSI